MDAVTLGMAKADARRRYQRPATGHFAALGDSITALGDSSGGTPVVNRNVQAQHGYSWHVHLAALADSRIRRDGYFATPGFTLTQIKNTHLPQVLAMTPRPEACIIGGGTNGVDSPEPNWTALMDIVQALVAAGIRPILVKIPPRHDSNSFVPAVMSWNARVERFAADNGFQIFDMFTPVVDPSAGIYAGGLTYTGDYVHPNAKGLYEIAKYNANRPLWLNRFGEATQRITPAIGDPANLIDSNRGLFAQDANADGLADGWTVGAAGATFSRVQDTDGYWIQYLNKAPSSSTLGGIYRAVTTGFAPGDRVALAASVFCDAADLVFSLIAAPYNSSGAALDETLQLDAAKDVRGGVYTGQRFRAEYIVPAGTASFRVLAQVGSAAPAAASKFGVKRLTFEKL